MHDVADRLERDVIGKNLTKFVIIIDSCPIYIMHNNLSKEKVKFS